MKHDTYSPKTSSVSSGIPLRCSVNSCHALSPQCLTRETAKLVRVISTRINYTPCQARSLSRFEELCVADPERPCRDLHSNQAVAHSSFFSFLGNDAGWLAGCVATASLSWINQWLPVIMHHARCVEDAREPASNHFNG